MPSVLFVCLGNICRSPLAEGVFRHVVQTAGREADFVIDSAGTGGWHQGDPPDPRSIDTARAHGIDITSQRARQIRPDDFTTFDLMVAMDADNLRTLRGQKPSGAKVELRMLLENPQRNVPDPYYGGPDGFELVYQLVLEGCTDLLKRFS